MGAEICRRLESVCPDPATAYNMLKRKKEITHRIFRPTRVEARRHYIVDYAELLRYTQLVYGRVQTASLSVEQPPDDVVRRAVLTSYAGLVACIYGRYYCERGFLQNDFVTVVGPGGLGKSTYAYYLVDILGGILLTKEDDVLTAIAKLYAAQEWRPIVVLDDIAAIISKYWFMDRKERVWSKLFKALEYAKDFTGVLMTTARSLDAQPKRFRELVSIRGIVKRYAVKDYIVDVIEWRRTTTPLNSPPDYVDVLWPGLRLPEDTWRRIMLHRRLRSQILLLETLLELAEAGQIQLTEQDREKITKRLEEMKKKLREIRL